jgi:hypothetical protein
LRKRNGKQDQFQRLEKDIAMKLLQLLVAALTVLYGIWAVFAPETILALTGLTTTGSRGVTEARVALGALYLGLGGYCLWSRNLCAFGVLGAGYAAMAAVRLISIFVDGSGDTGNWTLLTIETGCAIALLSRPAR